ncbi:unnamed protein product [Malus baccata var. baccata]
MTKQTVSPSRKGGNKKNKERKMMNADGLHSRHGDLTRQMAKELQMKEEEVREDKVVEEEVEKKDEEEEIKIGGCPGRGGGQGAVYVHVGSHLDVGSNGDQILLGIESQRRSAVMESRSFWESKWGWAPWRSKEEQDLCFNGDFSSGLGNPIYSFLLYKIPVRHFDYRDDALYQMMYILRMMAFIFYRIDDLQYHLIFSSVNNEKHFGQGGSAKRKIRQLMKRNGKRASSKAGNKNISERRMMMNADGFHIGHGVLTRRVVYIREQSLSLPFVLKDAQIKLSSSLYSCYYIPSKLTQTH